MAALLSKVSVRTLARANWTSSETLINEIYSAGLATITEGQFMTLYWS